MLDKPQAPAKPQAIRDAATLVLWRRRAGQLEFLIGRRHGGHAFMPNRYVFPGGRVDAGDYGFKLAAALNPVSATRLCRSYKTGRRKAMALALAAIRETFEEAGLRLAAPPAPGFSMAGLADGWKDFCQGPQGACLMPDPGLLTYIFRAVTPPGRPRRFDTRFFVAPAEAALGDLTPSAELGELHWVTPDTAASFDLPNMTKYVIGHLEEWLVPALATNPDLPIPYFRSNRTGHELKYE